MTERRMTLENVRGAIQYSVTLEPEDVPIEGNVMASGDEETDPSWYGR